MKVLQVVGDSKFGGATYLILQWCEYLAERGDEVHVLSTDALTIKELRKISGVTVIQTIRIPRDVSPLADLKAIARLSRFLRSENFDLIHTHTSTPGFIGRIAAWLVGTPIRLHTAHGWPVTEFSSIANRALYTPLENFAARLATRVICVSDAVVDQGIRFHLGPRHKLVAVRNGIDPLPFLQQDSRVTVSLRRKLGIPDGAFVIGNTNRLSDQKDVQSLIECVPSLRKLMGNRQFMVLLSGDGPLRSELEELSKRLGVEDSVRFLGFRRDIPRLLAAVDVFVSPSLWEGLSISIMEAMAAARPIVTTDIKPNAELIEHGVNGLLVQTRSPEAIAGSIARFALDEDLAARCGAAARKRLLEEFTIERMFQEQWDLYQDLTRASRGIESFKNVVGVGMAQQEQESIQTHH